ncbi:MAG: TonB-dependent receptor [Thermoanaerobaculia bacterium]
MQRFRSPLALLALILALAPLSVFAQGFQVGSIAGTITDNTGGALPGVTVTVTNTERGVSRTEVTDPQGRYRFANLPLGPYRVVAALEGFQNAAKTGIQVQAEKTSLTDLTLGLAATTEAITVTAEAPVVDPTNVAQTTNVSTEEFERAPVGRSYQSIVRLAPGVVGGSNPNTNGSLSSSNQFLFDGVDTTDPTTGTFGANINFEAIQEVNVLTSGVSAEYGRATGAFVNVITKSGTNDINGSVKAIVINDDWNADNKTVNMATGASLQRTKLDHNNIRYSGTLGGPIWRDHVWFFGAYDQYEPLGSRLSTFVTNEEFSSNPYQQFENYRVTAQLTPSHQIFGKYSTDPYTGIVRNDYSASGGDLYALVTQDQGGDQWVAQYSGVFGSKVSAEAMISKNTNGIQVGNYKAPGPFDNGSAVYDFNSGRYQNGLYFATRDNVTRPRDQFAAAASYFTTTGSMTHDIKVGIDRQEIESTSAYSYTNNRAYNIFFDSTTYTMEKNRTDGEQYRYDFVDAGPQTSKGKIDSLFLRDKINIGRFYLEAGLRYEMQDGQNDVGADVVDASSLAPRFSGSYDLKGNGRSLVTASAGRFYDFILQGFVDSYAQTVQRGVYDVYIWNVPTQAWDFSEHVDLGGASISPNLGLEAPYVDEYTIGFQQQLGASMGVGARLIYRNWGNFIDDVRSFSSTGATQTSYINTDDAERTYRALQLSFDKRFANNWSFLANYTYSRARGNHFGSTSSNVFNFAGETCRIAADASPTAPAGRLIPCDEVIASSKGTASYDYPHVLKALGVYSHAVGPVNLSFGLGGEYDSGQTYSKTTSAAVLRPGTSTASGQTLTYYYDGRGSERLGSTWTADTSIEATYGLFHGIEVGLKGEIFNITDNQNGIATSDEAWCNNTATAASTAACTTTQSRLGIQRALSQYQAPRNFRLTALIRF